MEPARYNRGNTERLRLLGWKCNICPTISLKNDKSCGCKIRDVNIQLRKPEKQKPAKRAEDE